MGRQKKMRSSMKAVHEALSSFRTAVGAPPCLHLAKTLSFRDVLTSFNSVYYAATSATSSSPFDDPLIASTSSSRLSSSSDSSSLAAGEPDFVLSRGAINSKRFFFNPCGSKSITGKDSSEEPAVESVPVAMASMDPYRDFRSSMDEMVEAYGFKDWSDLEELLQSYLQLNKKSAHGFIVQAFVDLIVYLAAQGKIRKWPSSTLEQSQPSPCVGSCI